MSAKNTKPNAVRFTLDVANPPPLTPEQQSRLSKLAHTPDKSIDYSDIPSLVDRHDWYQPGLIATPENKQQVTLRIDKDVLEYYRAKGRRYQTMMNAVLRSFMTSEMSHQPPKGGTRSTHAQGTSKTLASASTAKTRSKKAA